MRELMRKIAAKIKKEPEVYQAYEDLYKVASGELEKDKAESIRYLKWLAERCGTVVPVLIRKDMDAARRFMGLHKRALHAAAVDDFDSYLQYLEWNRDPEKMFYMPRRPVLKPLVDDLQDLADGKIDFLGVSLPPRVGKLLSDDTPIMTRDGWKNHGDLKVGDYVVGLDGEYKRVVHVFEKNVADYEVEFTNGEKIKCHGKHEWVVYNRHRQKWETLETEDMLHQGIESGIPDKRGHRYHFMLPPTEAMLGQEMELPIDPYVFGLWLGDGTTSKPALTVSNDDQRIVYEMVRRGYGVNRVYEQVGCKRYEFKGLRSDLQKLGLCKGHKAHEKYIPEIYLRASISQRLELLAGLIDTDGTVYRNRQNRISFSTTSTDICNGICELISTFGWRYSKVVQPACTSSSGVVGKLDVYTILFCPTMKIPCRVPRKKVTYKAKDRRIAVKCIRKIEPVRGNCIQVEGGIYRAGKTMLPTHNSTLCIFFMTWIMGKRPDVANVMSGHSDKLTDGFYREILSVLSDKEEYLWHEVFPGLQIVETSAKNETIDLEKKKRFPTMTCRSVSGTLTGAVEIGTGGILYCDDLVEDLQESLNPLRLQAKYDAYLNQLKDRKKLGARELMVGTRWNVSDPLGRIKEQYADNPRYRFRVIPALNEDNESNFMYAYGKGFDTAYYMDMKDSIDDATWCAKYMGSPYIREGLLFPEDELLTYNGVLPDGEPTVIAVCDVAWGGGDSLAMPFAYVYGDEVYIHDVIFNKGDKEVTRPVVIGRTLQHKPYKVRFEANNGGHEYADIVDAGLREKGFHTNITAKKAPSSNKSIRGMGKVARIIQFSPDIKKFYFLADKYRSREYRAFMREVTTFVQTGNNLHDDACDSLAMLADELAHGRVKYEVIDRLW